MKKSILSTIAFFIVLSILLLCEFHVIGIVHDYRHMLKEEKKLELVKTRHRHHGIGMSLEFRGEQYFYNEKGQKCRL